MTDISRRASIKLLTALAASLALPFKPAFANTAAGEPSLEVQALRQRVQEIVDKFDTKSPFAFTQYGRMFRPMSAAADACATCDDQMEDGVQFTQVRASAKRDDMRLIWHVAHQEVGLGCPVASAADLDDLPQLLRGLCSFFKEHREIRAADIFNNALRYDSAVVGDGVSLCSTRHLYETGVWANTFPTQQVLSPHAVKEGLIHLKDNIPDLAGVPIKVRGKLLVVPVAQMAVAERVLGTELHPGALPDQITASRSPDYFVCDYLTSNHNCFILTDMPGLVFSERKLFSLRVDFDETGTKVVVIGEEKNGFGCHDPRAVFCLCPDIDVKSLQEQFTKTATV